MSRKTVSDVNAGLTATVSSILVHFEHRNSLNFNGNNNKF